MSSDDASLRGLSAMTIVHRAVKPNHTNLLSNTTKQKSTENTSPSTKDKLSNQIFMSILYGMVNAAVVAPVMMSFGSIIYGNVAFTPYLPILIKLTLVSSIVHQLCFSTMSSLPFAVGQVQDSGLIFLSRMATDIVNFCHEKHCGDETLLATVTVGLSSATAILGLGLIIIGKMRLAGFVQMLPKCVVGGYLAFIGWFCGRAGTAIMAGTDQITIPILVDNIILVSPGVLGGVIIFFLAQTCKHVAILPAGIVFLLALFYLGLVLTGTTVETATEYGWIRESQPSPMWYQTWTYLNLTKVDWSALPQLLYTELSMIFVVALSSSLDVAAIELELNQPLNYNRELAMVGISNFVSGITGGYTGSYIFSQSILSLRAGINSRLSGYVVALFEVIIVIAPVPILAFVPNFFYGAMLSMICVGLMYDWLWRIRLKVTRAEHMICLATFGLTLVVGVESAILSGIAIYFFCRKMKIDVGEVKADTIDLPKANTVESDKQSSICINKPELIMVADNITGRVAAFDRQTP